jgi:iron complex transport system permease protein
MHPAPPLPLSLSRQRAILIVGALLCAAIACLLVAGMSGSVAVSLPELPGAVAQVLRGQNDSLAASLVELRATRALMAFVTGGALALAGVMMQALLRNPLADPYVLGISAGASVGALFALLMMCAAATVDDGGDRRCGGGFAAAVLAGAARPEGGMAAEGGTSSCC